jgi:hypothetical protein
VAERFLRGTVDVLTDPKNPRGCLIVQGALACGQEAERIKRELASHRTAAETALRRRFRRARAEGDLPSRADPAELARYVAAVVQGMSVQAATGAKRAELLGVAKIAMRAWPSKR